MKDFIVNFSIKKPKWVFIATLLASLLAGGFIPKINIDTDPENMLPKQQQDRVYHNEVKNRFNLHDAIVVGLVSEKTVFNPRSLAAIEQLATGISQLDGVIVHDLMALSTIDNVSQKKNEDGSSSILFEWMMKKAPQDDIGAKWIDEQIDRLPLLQNTLVSKDNKATAIYVPIQDKNESYRIATEIQQLMSQLDTEDEYHITGLPVAEDTFGFEMFVQMGISAPLAALMIFVLMWVFFRNLKFIAAPMIIAMATVIITMGVMIGMGFTVHIMSSMIPIFLMPIAVVDSIHVMSEFADNYKNDDNRTDTIKTVIKKLYKPMLFTSITSSVGFLSLLLTPIPPVQVFGVFVAIGILLAFILTIVFIPAYLTVLKKDSLASITQGSKKTSRLETWLPKLGRHSIANSKMYSVLFILVTLLGVWGISKIEINDNPVRWFKSDHPIRVADKTLNQHFAGTYDAYIVLETNQKIFEEEFAKIIDRVPNQDLKQKVYQENEITETGLKPALGTQLNQALVIIEEFMFEEETAEHHQELLEEIIADIEVLKSNAAYFQKPEALKEIENLQQALQSSGYVGKSNSLADAVKTVNRELKSGTEKDYQIPQSQVGVAQALLQYQSSHRPHDLWHMTSKDYTSSVIWIQLKTGDNQDMSKVEQSVADYLLQTPLAHNVELKWAGKTYLNKVWQDEMVKGMATSLLSAFVVVMVMMMALFRSVIVGLIAMLPLTITIIAIYGLIGWFGKDYDMPIAVLSALTLGLSIDFAIHFIQRARDIYKEEASLKKTMVMLFEEPANAISRNAIVIALGFTPLLVAPLMPYVTVGFFLATIMAVSAIVTLILLPICIQGLKKYVLKHN